MRIALLIFLLVIHPVVAFGQTARATEFSLKDLKGKTARLKDYRGKVVLINFWATWCAPCRAEMPELIEWQKEYKDRGLQIIGITYPPYQTSDVRAAARQLKINYPILFGTDEIAALYRVRDILPVSVVIDREGNIRARITGIMDREEFERKVLPLLKPTESESENW
jgi:thiol-disulfide isomerase/thioredoxin